MVNTYVDESEIGNRKVGPAMLTFEDIDQEAERLLPAANAGDGLDRQARVLIELAVSSSVTSLNPDEIRARLEAARSKGATDEQIHEILALTSGLGVHTFMVSAGLVAQALPISQMDEERQELWARYVGDNPYWAAFEVEIPGFLASLLTLSTASFRGFFDYCSIAWATRTVPAVVKELAAMACDVTPQHRFGPGFRLHLKNALKLGAGRKAVEEALEIGRRAPDATGVR